MECNPTLHPNKMEHLALNRTCDPLVTDVRIQHLTPEPLGASLFGATNYSITYAP